MTRVLLVDDNATQRKLSRAYLEDAGYEVDDAGGVYDALRCARRQRPAVIVSDVMMDDIDGFGLCRRLQDDTLLASIPIVLVSAHYDDRSAQELARSLGASALIVRTPDFSAEMAGIVACVNRPYARRSRRESYEAHLETNAKQMVKLAEQMRRAELRWRSVFENAHDTVTVLTTTGLVVEANQRWEDVLGIAPADMIGRHIREFSAPGLADHHAEVFAELRTRGSQQVLVALAHANGSVVHMEFASRVVDVDGEPYVIAIGRDMTEKLAAEQRAAAAEVERRKLEERLVHAQRLETIGQLTGSIAHDFNNILAVVLANAEMLVDELPQGPASEGAADIRDVALRATALTRQLLAFGRRQVLELVDLDVGEVVRSVSRMLRRLIGSAITFSIEERVGAGFVRADVVQLEQVIMNLAVNARDAMPNGGKLVIETAEVHVDDGGEMPAGDYVVVSVSDTGCGMSAETQHRIFEPFFTTKDRSHGTGLGLSTCFGIVKQLGGEIVVASELGRGTTMKVYLPRIAAVSNV